MTVQGHIYQVNFKDPDDTAKGVFVAGKITEEQAIVMARNAFPEKTVAGVQDVYGGELTLLLYAS
jgi:hypothetical protein